MMSTSLNLQRNLVLDNYKLFFFTFNLDQESDEVNGYVYTGTLQVLSILITPNTKHSTDGKRWNAYFA